MKIFPNPAFLIATSNLQTDVEEVLAGFVEAGGADVNLYGAMAGDDLTLTEQFVFTNRNISDRAIVVCAIDQQHVDVEGKASTGWKALGTAKTITKCVGNQVFEIDGKPALDLCLKYSGLDESSPSLALDLSTNIPLQLQRKNGAPIMRPAYRVDKETRAITISGKLREGDQVKFSLPPDFDTIESVVKECQELKAKCLPDADALILFNCGARHLTLGPAIVKEIEGLQAVWNVPMVGMFSSAELARATDGELEMHNLTSCYLALKEK